MNDTTSIIIFVVIVVCLVWLLFRLRGRSRNPPHIQVAMGLISNVNDDLKLLKEKKPDAPLDKKFKVNGWHAYEFHLDFLDKDTQAALKECFPVMVEYNKKLDIAKATFTPSKEELAVDSLFEALRKSREGLAKWIQENISKESTRGIFSWK